MNHKIPKTDSDCEQGVIQSMSVTVTVVIPVYNGAQRIHKPLEALQLQTLAPDLFEVLIINNASTDSTREITETHWATLDMRQRGTNCRVVDEPCKGLTHARICGVKEAKGSLICFLDDDNIPDQNYLEQGLVTFTDSSVGLAVSRIFPSFEQPQVPPSIRKREHLLAINAAMGTSLVEWPANGTMIPSLGAGLWVRKDAFCSAVPWQTPAALLSDRQGNALNSGGDIEIGLLIGRAGYKRVYQPKLVIHHIIPASRFKTQYFCRLIVGIIRSDLTLQLKYLNQQYGFSYIFSSLARLVMAVFALPLLALQPDGLRESLFVLTARWAKLKGPYSG